MRFTPPLVAGRLVRRYKRFLADIELADGTTIVAHCANPGSMKTCVEEGAPVWLSKSSKRTRKLPYTWEVTRVGGAFVYVNPVGANSIVVEAIKRGRVAELVGYDVLQREVPYGKRSRVDIVLRGAHDCFVEVKNVTLNLGGGRAAFPDSVTERGTRHLEELIGLTRRGTRAVLFFCVSRSDALEVQPADAIDPTYGGALRRAAAAGVELLAYRADIGPEGVELVAPVPVVLP